VGSNASVDSHLQSKYDDFERTGQLAAICGVEKPKLPNGGLTGLDKGPEGKALLSVCQQYLIQVSSSSRVHYTARVNRLTIPLLVAARMELDLSISKEQYAEILHQALSKHEGQLDEFI
jgi:hypothetical protein